MKTTKRKIAILGSTGSIGTQALDVIRTHSDLLEAHTLTAGSNADLLIRQAREFRPDTVVIADATRHQQVRDALEDLPIKVYAGADALCQAVESDEVDIVLTAMVGFAGLLPTVHAIRAHKAIALANKETLVVAGDLIMQMSREASVPILPVDSEHSAIFQSLIGEQGNPIRHILLTASGGPFRTATDPATFTPERALQHPSWTMGDKITIDSATLLNKGFEMIEACHLFSVTPEQVQVLVHPESVIHSAVEYTDGSVKAQLAIPDMRLPIQYALLFPQRAPLPQCPPLDLLRIGTLHFHEPDVQRFPCLALAYEAARRGGTAPCILNAAGEVTNLAFRRHQIPYTAIAPLLQQALDRPDFHHPAPTLDDLLTTDAQVRAFVTCLVTNY